MNDDTSQLPGIDLTVQSLYGILQSLACWGTRFIMIIMVIALLWYGFQMVISRGNPTKFGDAKKSLGFAIIGMIVILGAYTIISTVGYAVTSAGGAPDPQFFNFFLPISC